MNLQELAQNAFELLSSTVSDVYSAQAETDIVSAFAYRHARHILELAEDFFRLQETISFHSSPILLRGMLESLFCLGATANRHAFAAERTFFELHSLISQTEKRFGCILDPNEKTEIQTLAGKIRDQFHLDEPKEIKIRETARCADLEFLYNGPYFVLSGIAHASVAGVILCEHGGILGFELDTLATTLAVASVKLVTVYPLARTQHVIDIATKVIQDLMMCEDDRLRINREHEEFKAELWKALGRPSI